jgi:hypothetical protein
MADLDKQVVKHFAEVDRNWAAVVSEMRWAFSNLDDAGEALGKAIKQAAELIAKNCDNPQVLLAILEFGAMALLERINEED